MLTSHDDIVSIDRAYQIGANSFATKPVNWRQLSYQIRDVVRTTRVPGLPPAASQDPLKASGAGAASEATERDVQAALANRH